MPVSILAAKGYKVMLEAHYEGKNAFEQLNEFLGLEIPISEYINIYRNHYPNIVLPIATECLLAELKNQGNILGLITDGRSIQQRHKIDALGLKQFFNEEDIIISEEFGSEKPSEKNFFYFMNQYSEAEEYIYVGDNPQKDFLAPNRLGWYTLGLLDNGQNIHRQQMDLLEEYLPMVWVKTIDKMKTIKND